MRRYSSYKDSGVEWIGEIPNSWEKTKLKFTLEGIVTGGTPDTSNNTFWSDEEIGINWISISDITSNGREILETKKFISQEGLDSKRLEILPIGSLIYSIYGSIGKVSRLGIPSTIHQGILGLKTNSYLESIFLEYYLIYFKEYVSLFSSSNTQENLNQDKVSNFEIPLPPLSEQKQIVSFLDRKTEGIDKLIQTKVRKIELLKEYRTSLINEIVTKGLNPNVEMKDCGVEWIGEIPSHFHLISIKHLVTTKVTDGPHLTPNFQDDGIPFLSVEGVVGNKIDFQKIRGYISLEDHLEFSKKCKPQRDDILLVKSGSTTGKSTIVETDIEFNIWSPLCIIRSNKLKVLPKFTFMSFQSDYFRKLIELNWSYGTQPNIGMGIIENLRIVVPPISEQTQIVSYLDEQTQLIDKNIQTEERKIELLKEFRQSLISEVVTGKIKVCNDEEVH